MIGVPTPGLSPVKGDEEMTGSLLIVDVDSCEAAEDFVKKDPYA